MLLIFSPQDSDGTGELAGSTPQVMGHSESGILALPLTSFALKLLVHLVDHPQTAGTDRMSKAFLAAVGIYGELPV